MPKNALIPLFTLSNDKFYVGAETGNLRSFGTEFCVLVDFPKPEQDDLVMKFGSDAVVAKPVTLAVEKEAEPVVTQIYEKSEGGNMKQVAESAFFGEANGEWSLIDFAFIAVIVVLLLCFCLGLYGCWSKKKKMEKDSAANRPAKNNHRRQAIE